MNENHMTSYMNNPLPHIKFSLTQYEKILRYHTDISGWLTLHM